MKVQRFENGHSFRKVYTEPSEVVEFLEYNMNYLIDKWKRKSEKLEEENQLLRDNEYVKKVEEENARLRKELNTAFVISSAEREKNKKWIDEHRQKHLDKRWITYHYEFHPTSIGVFGKCVCDYCKEENDLGEV